jgi:IS1 family transposase
MRTGADMPKKLKIEKKTIAISMLCEGNSIRGVERMTGVHRDTVMRLALRVGNGMKAVQDELFVDLQTVRLELDEIWGFIGAKRNTARRENLLGKGDIWTWVALDADTKLVPAWHIGQRSQADASVFVSDLKGRLVNRPQISTDGLRAYAEAIEAEFGADVDYASIIKTFKHSELAETRRYSPPEVFSAKKEVKQGNPEWDKISTSYVEKQNHTMRMHCRRLSRLTNAFSKKRENFEAAIALHFGYYNLVKAHGKIKCTPAMEAGKAETFWTVRDLVERGEAAG